MSDPRVAFYDNGILKPFQPRVTDHVYPTHGIEVFGAPSLANVTGRRVRWGKAGTNAVGTDTQIPGQVDWTVIANGASALSEIRSPVARCLWLQGEDAVSQSGYTQANFESDYRAIRDGIRALMPLNTVWFDWLQLTNLYSGAGSHPQMPVMRAAIAAVANDAFSTLCFADVVPGEDGLHYSCDQHFDLVWPAYLAAIQPTL